MSGTNTLPDMARDGGTAPSRAFMVQQSILDAVPKCWPASAHLFNSAGTTLWAMGCDHGPDQVMALLPYIRAEFARIASRYQGVANG